MEKKIYQNLLDQASISQEVVTLKNLRTYLERMEFSMTLQSYAEAYLELRIAVYVSQMDFVALNILIRRYSNSSLKINKKLKEHVQNCYVILDLGAESRFGDMTKMAFGIFKNLDGDKVGFEGLLVWNYERNLARSLEELYGCISLRNFMEYFAISNEKQAKRKIMHLRWELADGFITPVTRNQADKETTKKICKEQIEIISKAVAYIESNN